jgi:hypothetical protein
MAEYLSFVDVAAEFAISKSKVRQLVMEDRTLLATRFTPNGMEIQTSGSEGLHPYGLDFCDHLTDDGLISTDIYEPQTSGKTVLATTQHTGYLRIERSNVEKFKSQNLSYAVTSKAPVPMTGGVGTFREETSPLTTTIHSTKPRRNVLTPVIELAKHQCLNPADTAEVWAALLVLANCKHPPLIRTEEKGIEYLSGDGLKTFTRDALNKRIHPTKRGKPGKRR